MAKYLMTTLLLIFLLTIPDAYSQSGNVFNLHGGLAIPIGDFGDDDIKDDKSGLAGMGFGLGGMMTFPITQDGLGIFFGLDLFYNGWTSDAQDDFEKLLKGIDTMVTGLDVSFPYYLNIPISAGVGYSLDVSKGVTLFGNAGLTYNFLKLTSWTRKVMVTDIKIESITEFDLASAIGFKLGAGIKLSNNMTIGINYFLLGEHKIKGTVELKIDGKLDEENSGDIDDRKIDVSILMLTVGINL